jgi:hypothetical protein
LCTRNGRSVNLRNIAQLYLLFLILRPQANNGRRWLYGLQIVQPISKAFTTSLVTISSLNRTTIGGRFHCIFSIHSD